MVVRTCESEWDCVRYVIHTDPMHSSHVYSIRRKIPDSPVAVPWSLVMTHPASPFALWLQTKAKAARAEGEGVLK